jgi:predicted ArsR family transcriptional regulator
MADDGAGRIRTDSASEAEKHGRRDRPGRPDRLGRPDRPVTRLTDPRALRAMAHPIRLSLIGVLRRDGPLTATQAGELIGESSASCSFHLRQLAKYGLVEEAGGGKGRERPWRATTMFTSIPDVAGEPETAAASGLLSSVVAERYFEALMRWLEAKPGEPPEWQHAAHFGDTFLHVTAGELAELAEQVQELLEPYLDRQLHPELRPPGSRWVSYLRLAFPGDLSGAKPREGLPGGKPRDELPGAGPGEGEDAGR